ncbi:hypothetical protein BCV69DRAFT_281357 [Microstroma glucosiphilum]|uniref:K Homology domain-containing protein n=1 Tax=Pseudomicrostroma glucosiphilum TaxID=1684307 RepID=A0A316UGQ5_9BASI|nr:hypothetical protein BCV69DRAFT_281357 [Pseudomicrostroma glucosiphilum]PWN22355.1 hypothetical protein BCV69DRAFT_281357 [Pseudomicrostroma glucosiphilum]
MSSRWDAAPQQQAGASASASGSGSGSPPNDPAAAAAAAAARIAASYGVGSSTAPSSQALTTLKSQSSGGPPADKRREGNEAPFNEFVDINDVKNRYLITRGPTQHQIHQDTGASLTTKGTWYPDRNLAKPDNPPLYIHIEAQTEEMLQKALARVNEVINSEAPQLIEERGMRGRAPPPGGADGGYRPPGERRKWTEERINLGLESLRNFNVRAKIVGPGGTFVKYIQAETGTRVQIKGRGSGFIEIDTGRESDDEMHIHITGPDDNQIAEAKTLAIDLLDAVKTEWEKSRQVLEQQGFAVPGPDGQWPHAPGGGNGTPAGPAGMNGGGGYGAGYGAQQQQQQQGQGYGGGGYAAQGQQQQQQQYGARSPVGQVGGLQPGAGIGAGAAAAVPQKSPEEEALDKYWKDYITWEDSFKAYHGRVPTKEDGGQDVPAKYRQAR